MDYNGLLFWGFGYLGCLAVVYCFYLLIVLLSFYCSGRVTPLLVGKYLWNFVFTCIVVLRGCLFVYCYSILCFCGLRWNCWFVIYCWLAAGAGERSVVMFNELFCETWLGSGFWVY